MNLLILIEPAIKIEYSIQFISLHLFTSNFSRCKTSVLIVYFVLKLMILRLCFYRFSENKIGCIGLTADVRFTQTTFRPCIDRLQTTFICKSTQYILVCDHKQLMLIYHSLLLTCSASDH